MHTQAPSPPRPAHYIHTVISLLSKGFPVDNGLIKA